MSGLSQGGRQVRGCLRLLRAGPRGTQEKGIVLSRRGSETKKVTREIVRFGIVGIFVIGTDLSVYHVLHPLMPYSVAKASSFICGAVVAFFLNKYWTFEQRKKSFGEVVRFAVANLTALGLNVLTNHIMLALSGGAVLAAVITATAVATVYLFFVFKFWVFR